MVHQAIILVGGRGTRLGPLTDDTPKPLLPVGGRPFLGYLVDTLFRHGFRDIVMLAGYRGESVARFCEEARRPGLSLRCVIETEPAGTGGALRPVADLLEPQFLLLNGDTLFDVNFNDLTVPPLPEDGSRLARLALRRVPDTSRYGAIAVDGERIVAMREKAGQGEGLINGGIYLLDKRVLDRLPASPCSIESDLFPRLVAEGAIEGRAYDAFFLDIGVPADFALAQTVIPARTRRPAAFLDRDGVLNEDVGYAHRPDQITWVAGAKAAVKRLNDAGFYVFVVTNQAGIARGYYGEDDVRALHGWMQDELRAIGAHVDAFYHCPHHPDHGEPPLRADCACRKPEPGMLTQAMADWPVDAERSFLVGDKDSDLLAAQRAGVAGTLFRGGDLDTVVAGILARSGSEPFRTT
ncbi:HAD-IIIA family hydrolase [Azospirillum rugosum]|uniref:D,D-heptose 1,7-bisphosphate phosphatase n=1 Tax=Azospirillum rugosum TaxID=416170 RepID=A0ABS4SNX4_9PROT|nr:HAD-IIIA family hydrolase [Azospirillum rugosum]MBP2294255.1 D-glycero-D-manno-heptose 1,7-bisphosphate phosphatase [Azospirillum rugosum]MDQ0527590.1 D-glycero-D-manno-heptose 1,7-bisphosphate phosphatase [Azospirillum rugosum]